MDAADPRVFFHLVKRIGPAIEDLDCVSAERDAPDQRAGARLDPGLALDLLVFGPQRIPGGPPIFAILEAVNGRLIGAAQSYRSGDYRFQHRLQIERRAADDLEHIAGRGLVFERFFEIARTLA